MTALSYFFGIKTTVNFFMYFAYAMAKFGLFMLLFARWLVLFVRWLVQYCRTSSSPSSSIAETGQQSTETSPLTRNTAETGAFTVLQLRPTGQAAQQGTETNSLAVDRAAQAGQQNTEESSWTCTQFCCCCKVMHCMRSLVLLLFGAPLGIVQQRKDEYRPDEKPDENKVPTLYIRRTRLSYQAIVLLAVLIFSFLLIAIITSFDAALLSVTRICSEDPNIYCYPEAIDPNDDIHNNITYDKEITDCAFWNSEGISSRVTFLCFRFKYSPGIFIAVFTAILSIFKIGTKFVAGILLSLGGCFNKCKCNKCVECARISLALIAFFIEYGLVIYSFILANQAIEDGTDLETLQQSFPKAAVVAGIVSTTLWLPWEKYAQRTASRPSDSNGTTPSDTSMFGKCAPTTTSGPSDSNGTTSDTSTFGYNPLD